jgi:serine/threonine-protein kinase
MMRRQLRFLWALGTALLVLAVLPPDARAQANDAAAAQALFNDAKRLMNAGQIAAACPKFAESQRLDPGIGTMLWLAECHAKTGRNASAWALFSEAEALARKTNDPRAAVARDEARKLEPKLSKLVIEVPVESASDLEVKRDGVALGKPLWGTPIPTDPGVHRISASAPEKKTWEGEVTVPRDGGSATIKIPPLEAAPKVASVEAPAPAIDTTRGRTQRVIGVAVIGLGLAGAAVGTYFGLRAGSKDDESKANCDATGCLPSGYDARKDALTSATISDVAFIVAGAAVIGGAVLYLTAPKPGTPRTSIAAAPLAGGGAAVVSGVFP